MLSRNPDDSMDVPGVERNLDTIRRIGRVIKRSEAKGRKENMPRDLQVIAEKGEECREYQTMIETVRKK